MSEWQNGLANSHFQLNPDYSLENLLRFEMPANSVASLDFPQSP
jgi:hypothetical protein